jgi:hypothetical protein
MSVIKKYLSALITMLLAWVTTLPSIAATVEALMASLKDDIPARQHGEGQYDQLII